MKGLEDQIKGLLEINKEIETRLKSVENKLCQLEDQSRRENLLFFGIGDDGNESWEVCERKLTQFIKDKLGIDKDIVFQRVHRLGRPRAGVNARPIIAKFLLFKDKELVLRNAHKLKNQACSISEDFCQRTREKRKMLLPHLKKAKEDDKRAFLRVDTLYIEGTRFHVDGNTVKNSNTGAPLTWSN